MEEFSNLGYWIFSSLSECAGLQRGLEREISFLGQNIFGFWSLCHFPCLLWDPNAKTTTFSSPYPGLVLGGLTRNRLLIFPPNKLGVHKLANYFNDHGGSSSGG